MIVNLPTDVVTVTASTYTEQLDKNKAVAKTNSILSLTFIYHLLDIETSICLAESAHSLISLRLSKS